MKSTLTGISLIFLIGISAGISAQSLQGTSWQAVVGTPPSTIELHFSAIDTMSIKPTGATTLNPIASYVLSNDTVTLTDFNPTSTGCPTPGVYRYNIQNNILTINTLSDICGSRANFVTGGGGTWTRMGIGLKDYGRADLVNIYPVPAKEILNVDLFEAMDVEYSITDVSGRAAMQGTLNNESNKISVDQLPKGIYIFKIAEWGQSNRFSKI